MRPDLIANLNVGIMSEYETHTSQFALAGTDRTTKSDCILATQPEKLLSPEARKGHLYIVTESDSERSVGQPACQLVSRNIHKTFYKNTSLSITASLREAIRVANKALYQQNFHAPTHKRVCVGVTCAVVKGKDLFVAQVVPSQMYVLTEGTVRALPSHSSVNASYSTIPALVPCGALGTSLSVERDLYRCLLRPNDAFLICSSKIAPLLEKEHVESLLREHNPSIAIDRLSDICVQHEVTEAHAFFVAFRRKTQQASPTLSSHRIGLKEQGYVIARTLGERLKGVLPGSTTTDASHPTPAAKHTAPYTDPDRAEEMSHVPEQPDMPLHPLEQPQPLDLGESLNEQYARARSQRAHATSTGEATMNGEQREYGEHTAGDEPFPDYQPPIDLSDEQPAAAPYRPRHEIHPLVDMPWHAWFFVPLRYARSTLKDLVQHPPVLRRTKKPQKRTGSKIRHTDVPTGRRFPWLIFVAISLFVAVLILYGANLSRQSAEQQHLEYLEQAKTHLVQMRNATDHASASDHLDKARQAIEQVRASPLVTETNPVLWLPFQEVEHEYEEGLAVVERKTFFEEPVVLSTHPLPNGRFGSIVVPPPTSGITRTDYLESLGYIYVLDGDRSNARLYRIPREGGRPQPYLSPNDVVRNTIVGPVQAIAWRIDHIVAVDQGKQNFGYYFRSGEDWNYIRLGGSDIWIPRGRIDLETYEGNLYFWGAEPQEILKFTSGRYGDLPQLWLETTSMDEVDLGSTIDMAVDGKIYLLMPRGHIAVFGTGEFEHMLVPDTITPPISSVTRFFVTGSPEDGWIFLLDTLQERVIQLDKMSGEVIQQIGVRPGSSVRLDQLTDLYVDTSGSRPLVYLVNGNQIIRAALPAPPGSFDTSSPASRHTHVPPAVSPSRPETAYMP
jgi:serine/threonine protein phosphatase PrpC